MASTGIDNDKMASVLFSISPRVDSFLSALKYDIIKFLPKRLTPHKDHDHMRRHLDAHYCPTCGEYMYCRYLLRSIRHNHQHYKNCYVPKLLRRVRIHRGLDVVVWERHNPDVMRLVVSREQRQTGRRLRSFYQWTIEEWNYLYPFAMIREGEPVVRLSECLLPDILYTPDMI